MTDLDSQHEEVRSGKGGHGGAHISIRDPRVTAAAQWAGNVLQTLVVITLCFVAKNLYEVNLTLAADAVTKSQVAQMVSKHEQEIKDLNGRVSTLEGRNLRGGPSGH
jgi:hypothetical protein